jgi:hypothetical protein
VAFPEQRVVVFQDIFGARNVSRFAFDFQIVVDELSMYAQSGLQQPNVFIARTEQTFYTSVNANASFH